MVKIDAARVEQELLAGGIRCPECEGELRPWGHARRRKLRAGPNDVVVVPRRSRCGTCLMTHVLLPVLALVRRRDLAEAIGEALLRRAGGAGHRRIAALMEAPAETVRGWIRRFEERAELLRAHFTRLAFRLDPSLGVIEPATRPERDALQAILAAWAAACRRFGEVALWHFASGASGGRLINTSSDLPTLR